MTERPILMSAPMVRALLEGRKSQTRRAVKPQPASHQGRVEWSDHNPGWWIVQGDVSNTWAPIRCPYGVPGDRLWVKETWQYADWTEDGYPFIGYRADGARLVHENYPVEWDERLANAWAELSTPENYAIDQRAADRRWRPSIFLPRWASRIALEVTGGRVERLQEISEADALAEGVRSQIKHSAAYADLWDSLNAKAPWSSNPWVWVLAFRRIAP